MLPIKRILWPTDFSEPSYEALRIAKQMAIHFSAELFFMRVIKSTRWPSPIRSGGYAYEKPG